MPETDATSAFTVHNVVPSEKRLDRYPTGADTPYYDGPAHGCWQPSGLSAQTNGLLRAVHVAYAKHHPLVFSPDSIWLTISSGFVHHLYLHADTVGRSIVDSAMTDLRVPDDVKGGWAAWIQSLARQIGEQVGPIGDVLIADFSTTTPTARLASQVMLLHAFERRFWYHIPSICGIPSIRLTGSVDDWAILHDKVECLEGYGLEWWLPAVRIITSQFVRAASGDVDSAYWQGIYKCGRDYHETEFNGWIGRLFPYICDAYGKLTVRNPQLTQPRTLLPINAFPNGRVSVPLLGGQQRYKLEAGLQHVQQQLDSGAISVMPHVQVSVPDSFETLLDQLELRYRTEPSQPPIYAPLVPADVSRFTARFARVSLDPVSRINSPFTKMDIAPLFRAERAWRGRLGNWRGIPLELEILGSDEEVQATVYLRLFCFRWKLNSSLQAFLQRFV